MICKNQVIIIDCYEYQFHLKVVAVNTFMNPVKCLKNGQLHTSCEVI